MTTAPRHNRHVVGAHAVFSVRPARPGSSRPVAVVALLDAVRAVVGVRDAELRTAAGGDRTLHLDLVDGADDAAVAWSVTRILDERLGVEVDQTRSVLVDDGVDEGRSVPLDGPQRRVHLERLQVVTGGLDVRVDVALATASARVVGSASGPAVERTVLRTVAGATLNAVDALLEGRARCGLDQAELTDIGSDRLAVAVVTLLTPGQVDRLAGAALVRGDARQAMVRAVLSALNRRFESLLPESATTSTWAPSFPHSAPPLAVENTATYRTIMAGSDFPESPSGPTGPDESPYEPEPETEPLVAESTTGGYSYPFRPETSSRAEASARGEASSRADASSPGAGFSRAETTPSGAVLPDPLGPDPLGLESGRSETTREPVRGGRAARRAAAAAARGDAEQETPARTDAGGRAAHTAEPEYAPSTPLTSPSPSPFPESIAAPTGELELASGPGDAADLGHWAAATWDRLVRNDVTKDTPEASPAEQADAYDAYQAAAEPRGAFDRVSGSFPVVGLPEPAADVRTSDDLSAATSSAVFTPPAEPAEWMPPEEPKWSWPTSEEPAPAAEWAPPRWDEPASAPEQPGNVSSPYGRSTNGAAAATGLGGGLGGSYLEREYGGLGGPPSGGGRGRHGRADAPGAGEPVGSGQSASLGQPNGTGQPGGLGAPTGPNGYGTNGYGANGYGLGNGPGLGGGPGGLGSPARPTGAGDLGGLGPASGPGGYGGLGPASGVPFPSGPVSPGPLGPGPLSPSGPAGPSGPGGLSGGPGGPSGLGGPGGPNGLGGPNGPGGLGPSTAGPASSGPPRRRHAAEPTGAWPMVPDPLGPSGSWADPQPGPPAQREPNPSERGYRTGEYGAPGASGANGTPGGNGEPRERREQPSPRARRRYADEESGRHGGNW